MTKRNLATALLFCLLVLTRSLCAQTPTPSGPPSATFRDPFTVKFQFGDKHKVEQRFDKAPYVSEKTIHIFPGEDFGINVRREGEEIIEVSYQPDPQKADVKFKFEVQKLGKKSMMMLTTQSYLDKTLVMEAWMLLPEYKEPVKVAMLGGGDRRSIGRAEEVKSLVSRHPERFAELIKCLWDDDPVVRMRAADAAEKVTVRRSELLNPHKQELLGLLDEAEPTELRWHLALMVPRLALSGPESNVRQWHCCAT